MENGKDCIPSHLITWACTAAANGTGFFIFIDDVTADTSGRMNSKAYGAMLSALIYPNPSKRLTEQIDNDLKYISELTQEAKCSKMIESIT